MAEFMFQNVAYRATVYRTGIVTKHAFDCFIYVASFNYSSIGCYFASSIFKQNEGEIRHTMM